MTRNAPTTPRSLIVVGPSPDCTGGMARVVEQSIALDIGDRYTVHLHPMTFAPHEREGTIGRLRRHLRHLRQFRSLIRETRGGRYNDSAFGVRMRGQGAIADQIAQLFRVYKERLDFQGAPERKRVPFRKPLLGGQLGLFGGGKHAMKNGIQSSLWHD